MKPRAMDSLDVVEVLMAIEEAFDVDLPGTDGHSFSDQDKLVDWLEVQLSNQRPNAAAQELLRKLARDQSQPELAQGLDGPWRREQIAAIVREIFR